MILVRVNDVSIAFGLDDLLNHANLQLSAGERVCLIGRNGTGKSTLLKLIDDKMQPDSGEIWREPGLRVARLTQELPDDSSATVFDTVASGLAELGRLVSEYHAVAGKLAKNPSRQQLGRMEQLQHELEVQGGWGLEQRVQALLTQLRLPADVCLAELSGGWRRRVELARTLVSEPDLLLLDEPTNHLDIATIQWLEEQLLAFPGAVLFVSHDRALLQRLSTRILELDRGRLISWSGGYQKYLSGKAEAMEVEARHNAKFDKLLAREETWIRQGIKARRTRNEGRVRALEALREQRRQRREQMGRASFNIATAERSGDLVIAAKQVCFTWRDAPLVKDFSLRIMRGDRIGLIGPNGCGKSSLLRILLGQLEPRGGRIRHGTRLQIAYFDQLREQLEPEKSVIDNVAQGRETIVRHGRSRHVISYLSDFLFTPERSRTPVKSLSGGERNRLLLARLFSRAANLLVLDEPTNDLDIETLELLEELLMDYDGTLLLVSHDRAFLDNVVTSCLVFEEDGRVGEYVGGYSDWLRQRRSPLESGSGVGKKARPADKGHNKRRTGYKLGYKDQRELEQLPARIEAMETEQSRLHALSADPALYRRDPKELTQIMDRLKELENHLTLAYLRWEELENLRAGST